MDKDAAGGIANIQQLMANRTKQNARSSRFEWNAAGLPGQPAIHVCS